MNTSLATVPKVIFVTGASSSIGLAAGRLLAARGHKLMIGTRRTDRLKQLAGEIRAAGDTVLLRALNVTQTDAMQTFADAAVAEFGRVDVIVNDAGVRPLFPVAPSKLDERDRMIHINIRGVMHSIATVLPRMQAQGAGHVINVSSVDGLLVSPIAAL